MAADRLLQQDVYEEWGRDDVLPYVPADARSVLEVGCGRGGFGRSLRGLLGPEARLVGIDPVPAAVARARSAGFDEVWCGYFPDDMPDDRPDDGPGGTPRFDLICFNDVLEHVNDPWSTLAACHRHLRPGGRVLAAIPNIQHGPTVWGLLRGRWEYADTGVLDRTHVRFFTRRTMLELFRGAGFEVRTCAGANHVLHEGPQRQFSWLAPLTGDFGWMHFVVVGEPLGAAVTAGAADRDPPPPSSDPQPGRVAHRHGGPPVPARRLARRSRSALSRAGWLLAEGRLEGRLRRSLTREAAPPVSVYGVYRRANADTLAGVLEARDGIAGLAPDSQVVLHALDEAHPRLARYTVGVGPGARMPLLGGLIAARPPCEHHRVVLLDDDVEFVRGGLAHLVRVAGRADLDLAMPAHTDDSHATFTVTRRRRWSTVRRTALVEVGPVVVVSPRAFARVHPFPASAAMGWGLDVTWSRLADDGLTLGVVDATPVRHLGEVGTAYDLERERAELRRCCREAGVDSAYDLAHEVGGPWRPWRLRP